jgi:hypothetical protein
MRRPLLIPLTFIVAVATFFGGWELTYPSDSDPKNFRYVFWKAGVWKMNLDTATATMVGDANRDKLVVGKSVSELRERFGFLLNPSQTTEYLRSCNQTPTWKDQKVLFLRNSPWMVVFEGDRATNLVLCKGY